MADRSDQPPSLVVGLGNPILGDDGIGWRVADALERRLAANPGARLSVGRLEIDRQAVGGLALMERMVGYRCVVLVDAALDGGTPGRVWTHPLAELDSSLAGHLDSAHDASLVAALDAGRALGGRLPADVSVVGVSVASVDRFDEDLSPAVAAAVEPAVDAILAVLSGAFPETT
jgi:hydrogenase maturation protease